MPNETPSLSLLVMASPSEVVICIAPTHHVLLALEHSSVLGSEVSVTGFLTGSRMGFGFSLLLVSS